jgi:hypothetical protein
MDIIPGAPNTATKKIIMQEVVDSVSQNFHHAALVDADDELNATTEMSQVVPYVFIGSWDNSVDLDLLKQKNIRHVLNVTELKKKQETLRHMLQKNISYDHCGIENLPESPLRNILGTTYAVIKKYVDAKQNILVHCHQGLSTSVAVETYYVMKNFYSQKRPERNMLTMILGKIKEKRGYIDINFGFIEQLEDLEAELSGRPVVDKESLSIRRNVALKTCLNTKMAQTVRDERNHANKLWKITQKIRY